MKFPAQAALQRKCARGQACTACARLPTARCATATAVCVFKATSPFEITLSPFSVSPSTSPQGSKDEGESCYVFDQNLQVSGGSHGCGWDCSCPNEQSCLSGASKLGCVWTGEHCVRRLQLDDRNVKSNGNGAQMCGCNCGLNDPCVLGWVALSGSACKLFSIPCQVKANNRRHVCFR